MQVVEQTTEGLDSEGDVSLFVGGIEQDSLLFEQEELRPGAGPHNAFGQASEEGFARGGVLTQRYRQQLRIAFDQADFVERFV